MTINKNKASGLQHNENDWQTHIFSQGSFGWQKNSVDEKKIIRNGNTI